MNDISSNNLDNEKQFTIYDTSVVFRKMKFLYIASIE